VSKVTSLDLRKIIKEEMQILLDEERTKILDRSMKRLKRIKKEKNV